MQDVHNVVIVMKHLIYNDQVGKSRAYSNKTTTAATIVNGCSSGLYKDSARLVNRVTHIFALYVKAPQNMQDFNEFWRNKSMKKQPHTCIVLISCLAMILCR